MRGIWLGKHPVRSRSLDVLWNFAGRVEAVVRDLRERLARLLPARPMPPDPFATLALQARLSRLARELNELDHGDRAEFARGHHLVAAIVAYERTLDEACRLMGMPMAEGSGPAHRLISEATLVHAGWRW